MSANENKGIPNTPNCIPTEGATMHELTTTISQGCISLLKRMDLLLDDLSPDDTIGFSNGARWVDVATVEEIRRAAALAAPAPEAVKDDHLKWLTSHVNLELTWGEIDGWEDDCQWRIHSRNGGRNDREWKLRGYGPTVEKAIDAARAALNAEGK